MDSIGDKMRKSLGKNGEEIATKYLLDQGYKIKKRNFHTSYGEIDIICEKAGSLVFVEVKTRRSTTYGTPEEAVTPNKIQHLRKAVFIYLEKEKKYYKELRFDVIGILIQGDDISINHIEGAF